MMLKEIYDILGMEFECVLSTRPEGHMGESHLWDIAEKGLEDALNDTGFKWRLDPGEGAFYGPKIDIIVKDAIKRKFQCGTIQLDYNLPNRFNLNYVSETGHERPVMIHRYRELNFKS